MLVECCLEQNTYGVGLCQDDQIYVSCVGRTICIWPSRGSRPCQWLWTSRSASLLSHCSVSSSLRKSVTCTVSRPVINNNNNNNNRIQCIIRDFLQSPHSTANCLQHARSSGPGAIVYKSRATHRTLITCNISCYVPLGTKGQLSY